MWGKYGATCLAHSFLSVLTLFSNKKVVHSIKSLFMLQEIVTEDSTFCAALKISSHRWHFSSIFPQTYPTCQCPLTCSTCLWTIYLANWISTCCSKVQSVVSYFLKVSISTGCMGRKMRLTVFGTSQCICYSHYEINCIFFPLEEAWLWQGSASRCCGYTFSSNTANCNS